MSFAVAAQRPAARFQERRRFSRVRISLLGRYMLANFQEFPCQSIDISPGGVSVVAPVKAEVGSRVIMYLEQLGRLEGTVVRHTEEGFALSILTTGRKREKLAAQLTWLANKQTLGLPEDRRHERVTPRNTRSMITDTQGNQYPVRILDVSLSGAAFQASTELAMGDQLVLGKTHCRVVRVFDGGYAVEFRNPIAFDHLDDNIDL